MYVHVEKSKYIPTTMPPAASIIISSIEVMPPHIPCNATI